MHILMVSDGYKARYDGEPASLELFRMRLLRAGHLELPAIETWLRPLAPDAGRLPLSLAS